MTSVMPGTFSITNYGSNGALFVKGFQMMLASGKPLTRANLVDVMVTMTNATVGGARNVSFKAGDHRGARQEAINDRLIDLARQGHLVVRLKGGDPFVFGRGGEEMRALVEAGVDVVAVPGVSAAIAAPAAAGIPLTMRGVSSSLAVTTGEGGAAGDHIARLAAAADTLVVLMAHARLPQLTSEIAAVLGPGRPAAVVSSASMPEQKVVTGEVGGRGTRVSRDADRRRRRRPGRVEAPADGRFG